MTHKAKKNLIINLFKILVTILIFYVIFTHISIGPLIKALFNSNLGALGIALILGLSFTFFKILKWHILVKDTALQESFQNSIDSYFIGMSLGIVTPGRVGELARISNLSKDKRLAGAGLVLWDKIFDVWIVLLLSLWGILYFLGLPLAVIIGILLIVLLIIILNPNWLSVIFKLPIIRNYPQFMDGLRVLKRKTIILNICLTLLSYSIVLAEVYFLSRAFQSFDVLSVIIAYPLVMLANLIPITIGGLGVREGVAVILLGRFGLSQEAAFNSAFLLFLINTALPAVFGIIAMNREFIKMKLVAIVLIILGALIRFYNIGQRSLWLDEAITAQLAQGSIREIIINRASTGIHPPFYFVIIHFWIRLLGDSEIALRGFSSIFSVLSIYLMYKLSSKLFGITVGVISAFLFAFSPFQLYYSGEARMYPFLTFLFLLSIYLLYQWTSQSKKNTLIYLIIVQVIALYTHIYTSFLILAENIFVLIKKIKDFNSLKRWIVSQLVILIIFSPWIYVIFVNRTPDVYQGKQALTLNVVKNSFSEINLGYARSIFSMSFIDYLSYFFLIFFFIGLLPPYEGKTGMLLITLSFFVPFFILIAGSLNKSFFSARYLSPFIFGYFILIGRGIKKIKFYPIITILLMGIFLVDGLAIYNYNQKLDFISRPWRGAVNYIHSKSSPNDIVIITAPQMYRPFDYYNREKLSRASLDGFGNVPVDVYRSIYGKDRVWFVMAGEESADPRGKIKEWLDSNLLLIDIKEYYRLKVYLYEIPEEFNRVRAIFSNKEGIEYTVEIRYPETDLLDAINTFDELGIKATFFITANSALSHPELIKSILDKGHKLGSLGLYYGDLAGFKKDDISIRLQHAEEILENIAGREITLFRPPQSKFNRELLDAVYRQGFHIEFWSIDIRRWNRYNPETIAMRVSAQLTSGSIVNLGLWDNLAKEVLKELSHSIMNI